jgi:8-amino-7-oxononanoate synthase
MPDDPLAWLSEELVALESEHLLRRVATRDSAQRSRIVLGGRELVNFGSNDYLGLATDRRVVEAAAAAVDECGWGSGASPLVSGRGRLHETLEQELARFEGTEAALLFPSGYAANVGTISALVSRGDVIFSDANNHASIIDGCRLSRAHVEVYQHANADHLEQLLQQTSGYRRRLIVTDSLFSMGGDLAPLGRLAELAERHQAILMVDEAHGTGVFGAGGRGVSEYFEAESAVHVRIGTLSKALGSAGGFVAGSRALVDWLANRARSYVYSTASPEACCAAALAALAIVREEPNRRVELLRRAACLRHQVHELGWQVPAEEESSTSQIVPLVIGDPGRTMQLSAELSRRGYFVPGIRPPSVAVGQSLLRISLCYDHDTQTIDDLVKALPPPKA